MDITESKHANVVVVGMKGRLDANTSPRLEERLLGLIDGGERRLLLNFVDMDYVSSAGLRVLLMAAKRLKPVSGKVALAGMKDHIKEVFDIAGFSSVLPIFKTEQEALDSLA
jgi:anti-sigma B factor antagonist